VIFRKKSELVIDYFKKNYEEDMSLSQGVRLITRPLCEQVDNPRQKIEVCIVTAAGTRFLTADELDREITSIENEIAMDEEN
jgi:20S proteasome alpha/beta subunit